MNIYVSKYYAKVTLTRWAWATVFPLCIFTTFQIVKRNDLILKKENPVPDMMCTDVDLGKLENA